MAAAAAARRTGPAALTAKELLDLDKKLFGKHEHRPEPEVNNDCLVHDGTYYHKAIVLAVTADTFTAAYIDTNGVICVMSYMPKSRFRPIML